MVLRLGIPAMCAQFFNILYSIVDRAFVGHIAADGEIALASIGICAPVLTAITAFSSLVGIGGASVMSISIGKKDYKNARLAMNNAIILLLCLSAILTILSLIFVKPLLYALGCSDIMYPYASGYFKIYVTGTVAVLCGTGMNQFILAFGNAKRGMLTVMIGAIVNTILDPIFIYVFHMGIYGAAVATVIAQFCVLLYVLFFLFSDKPAFKLSYSHLNYPIVRQILTIGSLPFFIMLFDNLLVISLNFTLRKYGGNIMGDRYISCAAVVQSFMVLVFYPAQGITAGCGTLYSYHYGAGHYDKVMQVFRYVFYLCVGYMLLLCVAAQLIPETFAYIFIQEETAVILSASCIRKYTLGLLGVAIQYAIVDGLTAMGQIRLALPISFFRKILYIICVFLFPVFCSLENVFYAETISDIAGASVTVIVFITMIIPKFRLNRSIYN
ncbi:MAG: MATE family efflux transporter [Frisingicoccus sp.]|uniref:MATE family efflux transporter n=1 Tax=Frisingicoccus sp. TaxID=1918627 RepID=UPI00399B0DAF